MIWATLFYLYSVLVQVAFITSFVLHYQEVVDAETGRKIMLSSMHFQVMNAT